MSKNIKSTYDEYVESLTPLDKKRFDEGLKDFALSELILALMDKDEASACKLAKIVAHLK